MDTNSGISPSIPGDIFRPTPAGGERKDELSIFSGKTHTITTKAALRTHPTTVTTSSLSGSPSSISDSLKESTHLSVPGDNPSFTNVHPSLVMELRGFDGHIASQIREVYGTSNTGYASIIEAPLQEYSSRCQMELGQSERTECDETERQQLERREMEIEQRRLYRERHEKEQRRQLQEQEQYYRQQQQGMHEQEAQRQFELDRGRQEPRQYQSHVQQPHQVPSRHMQQHCDNDHHLDHSSEESSARHVTDLDPMPPHLLGSVKPLSVPQLQATHQHFTFTVHSECQRHLDQQLPTQPVPATYIGHEQHNDDHHSLVRVQPQQTSDVEAMRFLVAHEMEYEHQCTSHVQSHGRRQQVQPQPTHQEVDHYWAPDNAPYLSINQVTQVHGVYDHLQHYTPDGVLRGIAADDTSLQETWQSYMYKVRFFYIYHTVRAESYLGGLSSPIFRRLE